MLEFHENIPVICIPISNILRNKEMKSLKKEKLQKKKNKKKCFCHEKLCMDSHFVVST
jgi:hypothetical protein